VTGGQVVRVLPDVPAIDKRFDYLVPPGLDADVEIGTMVRVELHGRRVGGWVVDDGADPERDITLKPLAKVSSVGPPADLIALAEWAAWRWAGSVASFLRTASPPRMIRPPLRPAPPRGGPEPSSGPAAPTWTDAVFAAARAVVRLPPARSQYEIVRVAAQRGHALVLVPTMASAERLALALKRDGFDVARHPHEWGKARGGATVVGTRSAAWAPVVDLATVVVLDEHDETWQQEQAPTWHAREVAAERAQRAGVPCVLVSPTPSLEARAWGELVTLSRSAERAGWPRLDVVDRREEPPGTGLLSSPLAEAISGGGRVVCVLNRKGRSRLLACGSCGVVAQCERCDAAVRVPTGGELVCPRCDTRRPPVCLVCGATRFRNLRAGVSRVREELEALAREPVMEVTGDTDETGVDATRVLVGTEAVLHRVRRAAVVAFLDFDQELLAPRYRAAEEAMALLVRAARLVGGREGDGRVLVQTRTPDHEVIMAARTADPDRFSAAEQRRRTLLRFPPVSAMAVVSGPSAPAFMESFDAGVDVEVMGPAEGRWLLRADSHPPLLDALAATPRPGGRLRIEVDPMRL
jgi:primosomal protein N' (replication factor Y) (superfamily II helicase)